MKTNYFLVLITFLMISCNISNTSKKASSEEMENLYFSKEDITKVKPTTDSYGSHVLIGD